MKKKMKTPWHERVRPFAWGAEMTTGVFHKSQYPKKRFLSQHKGIVKVREDISPKAASANARAMFWEAKIIHALFPKNTVTSHAATGKGGFMELHMDEAPLQPNLHHFNYAHMVARKSAPNFNLVIKAGQVAKRKLAKLEEDHAKNWKAVSEVAHAMRRIGIDPSLENFTNVSFHNPREPIFLEPKIIDLEILLENVKSHSVGLSKEKQKQLLVYIERLSKAVDEYWLEWNEYNAKHSGI